MRLFLCHALVMSQFAPCVPAEQPEIFRYIDYNFLAKP